MPRLVIPPAYKFPFCLLILLFTLFSCGQNAGKPVETGADSGRIYAVGRPRAEERQSLKSNLDFFADSLVPGRRNLLQLYTSRYQPDSCEILTYKNEDLKESFEGMSVVRKIIGDKGRDTVFVLPPFNYCDEGESYCFTDQKLPRLHTNRTAVILIVYS